MAVDTDARRARQKRYYENNRQAYLDRNIRRREEKRKIIREAKDRPCADCGISYPYYVMDFDHRQDEVKFGSIGDGATLSRLSVSALLDEIAKCDVVCANCHRVRTWVRNQNAPTSSLEPT